MQSLIISHTKGLTQVLRQANLAQVAVNVVVSFSRPPNSERVALVHILFKVEPILHPPGVNAWARVLVGIDQDGLVMAAVKPAVVFGNVADGIVCGNQLAYWLRCAHARVEPHSRNGATLQKCKTRAKTAA